jgi:hypothetical protein
MRQIYYMNKCLFKENMELMEIKKALFLVPFL